MRLKQINNVPPQSLHAALQGELVGWKDDSVLSRVLGWVQGEKDVPPRNLYVLVDIARVPEKIRPKVVASLKYAKALPLLDDPRYEKLKQHGAMLVSHPRGSNDALLDAFGKLDSNVISAWVVSKLAPEPLAAHLRHAAFAYGPDKARYLLRWYDPLTTPILFRLGDPAWVRWFLDPISSWWYPIDHPQKEIWSRIEGGNRSKAESPVSLACSEELWEALVIDPLPYQIVDFAEKNIPSAFESQCYGVRVAKIEGMLEQAKAQGIREAEDLTTYVTALLQNPAREQEPHWREAVAATARRKAPLTQYFDRQ
jgi:hypothetical protein